MTIDQSANPIDRYIAALPPEIGARITAIRATIHAAEPAVEEAIAYNMPTFRLAGVLLHVGAFKGHIGIYPVPREAPEFAAALAAYLGEKSTLRLPHDQPIPHDLIAALVRTRAAENRAKAPQRGKRGAPRKHT